MSSRETEQEEEEELGGGEGEEGVWGGGLYLRFVSVCCMRCREEEEC
jgi:hypothetical protein